MTCCTGQGRISHGALTLWKASTSGSNWGRQASDFVLLVMNPKGAPALHQILVRTCATPVEARRSPRCG
jgi:hypothetical protein